MSDNRVKLILDRLELSLTNLPTHQEVQTIINDFEIQVTYRGLSAKNLSRLIHLICRGLPIGIAANLRIIRDFLIPREIIPTEVVLRIISAQSEGSRLPIRIREKLLRWLVVVHKYLQDIKVLSKLYGVLFSLLKYEILRPWVCHLLFISTTSVVVKPWRVQYLIELHRMNRESFHLCGLIMLYKEYAPQLIVDKFPIVGASVFRHPDPEFADKVERALELNSRQELSGHDLMSDINHFKMTKTKRQKLEIPVVQTDLNKMRSGIEDISTLQDFVRSVHKLEFPLQMASVLNDTGFALRLLIYKDNDKAWMRLNNWLCSMLFEEMNNPEALSFLLSQVEKFVRYTKILPIATEEFLLTYISQWDGKDVDGYPIKSLIFKLIAYLPMMDKSLFASSLLEPLGRILVDLADPNWGASLLYSFSMMIKMWDVTYGPLLEDLMQTAADSDSSLLGNLTIPEVVDTFQLLAAFVNEFGLDWLEQTGDDAYIQHALLFFYETSVATKFAECLPSIAIFSNPLAQRLLLSSLPLTFSRVCNLLASYENLFSTMDAQAPGQRDYLTLKTNVYEVLWTNIAFSQPESKPPALNLDKTFVSLVSDFTQIRNYHLSDLLCITHSHLFILTNLKILNRYKSKDYSLLKSLTCPLTEDVLQNLDFTYNDFKMDVLKDLELSGYIGPVRLIRKLLGLPDVSYAPRMYSSRLLGTDSSIASTHNQPRRSSPRPQPIFVTDEVSSRDKSPNNSPEGSPRKSLRDSPIDSARDSPLNTSKDSMEGSDVPAPPVDFGASNEPLAPDIAMSSDVESDSDSDSEANTTTNLADFM